MTTSSDGISTCETALSLHQAGHLAEAEQLYRQTLAVEPANFTARHALGILRAQQGRNEEALALIGAALKINPQIAPAWVNHGNVLNAVGRPGEALASYGMALAIAPGDFDALINRAGTFLALHRLSDAMRGYDHVLTLQPGNVEALNNRGNILRDLKRFEDALASYDRALAVEPRLAETLINRGVALCELRRPLEALASYDAALALKPDSAEAHNNRGFTLRRMGRLDEALAEYQAALAIEPDYAAALNNRAKVLCEMNRIAEGFADFTRAARIVHGAPSQPAPGNVPPHKARHDEEQRDHLGVRGQSTDSALSLIGGARLATPAINPGNDAQAVARLWQSTAPNRVVIDNFLTEDALVGLRRFCWDSTVWRTVYNDGYLGAFPEQGFACPLLAQIAEELRTGFPGVIGGHPLIYLWAFKYDSRLAGTAVHADEAAVNVNFWITPDEANLDPESGGLVIWDRKPPPDWDFTHYNGEPAPIRDYLSRSGANAIKVPYRANRAVMFDSDLFHETDTIHFRDGYRNRRINVTLLYGRRATETP